MKKVYNIEVRETLARVVSAEASSFEEARKIVEDRYYKKQDIVLDYSDLKSTYFFSVDDSQKEVCV